MTDLIGNLLFALLVPLAIADWVIVGILWAASRRAPSVAILERSRTALLMAIAVTLYFGIGANTIIDFAWFPVGVAAIFVRCLFVLLGIVPIGFLWLYFRGGFRP